ncbi:matrix metalloproteinase-14 isoform X2 [Venturia canescens]|uniref:matrix metalloproteinase-14 isoform X2 n=1 Tax=Venturia canescens TaxID=32260 RepID=UPI001C9BCC84|nr:matrix metalloproteinase-14 isoform X2 [Venturia canescens]
METIDGRRVGHTAASTFVRSLRLSLFGLLLCAKSGQTGPIITDIGAMRYLSQFGYLLHSNPANGGIITEDVMKTAIAEFQAFNDLNVTGKLDNETMHLMIAPRCGVKDKIGTSDGRSKRYILQGSRWRVRNLTYKITRYPRTKTLTKSQVDEDVAKAFAVWSDHTDLTFTQKSPNTKNVHIEIKFAKGEHGDGDPFDGPGGTLAHAYFPIYGGDAHFDDEEIWTVNSYRGTNLFQVAAHEFGHSLGLSHSDVRAALMAPIYKPYDKGNVLDSDDIEAIQALYGEKTKPSATDANGSRAPVPKTGEEDPDLCNNPKIDTIFNSAQGHIYAFKGDKYWKLTDDGIASGYPKRISDSWRELPKDIDAAFTYKNGKTYFFKGSRYWRYIGKTMDGDYPKQISEGFTGIPDNIDAATVWTGNGKIYFYKGTKFWRFDPTQKPPVKSTYPKLLSNWEGVPDNIDAALKYNGFTYFFKGNAYYRFNDASFSVDRDNPEFPRSSGYWWFGCKSANKGTLGNVRWNGGYPSIDNSFFYGNLEKLGGNPPDNGYDDARDEVGDIILDAVPNEY